MFAGTEEIGKLIETIAPREYACAWDNTGFQVNLHNEVRSVLVCLDVTPKVIIEAAAKGCGMIVAHHPLLFHEIKRVDTESYVGECIAELVRANVSLYCAHTSMDHALGGINSWLADIYGLQNRCFLETECWEAYVKVAVCVPEEKAVDVQNAMADAGAGRLGHYSRCAFSVCGEGTFLPDDRAVPHIGSAGKQETVREVWVQALAAEKEVEEIVAAIRKVHPYEMPAIDVFPLKNGKKPMAGAGIVGDLPEPVRAARALDLLKQALQVGQVRFHGDLDAEIKRIAVCGGAGGDLIKQAERKCAELFITGEVKHNYYAESGIMIAEAGHFETEKCFCGIMAEGLQKALNDVHYNICVLIAEDMERPYINY